MNSRLLLLAILGLLVRPDFVSAQGNTLPTLPEASIAPAATPANPVPPALQQDLTRFIKDELLFNAQDDAGKVMRFYTFPLEDEGKTVTAEEFKRAWGEYTKSFANRKFGSTGVKFLRYDPAADVVELQQTFGTEMQPKGHPDIENVLTIRQLRILRASKPARAIDMRYTVKEFWTYDTRLSEADHYQPGHPPMHLAKDITYPEGIRAAVNAIILQDRANYYAGKPVGRDKDDEPCAYFDDAAHRELLYKARLKLIPDTPATLEAILNGTPRVRVSFSDNLRGENVDGRPVLNVGLLGP